MTQAGRSGARYRPTAMRPWNLVGWLAVVATAGLTYETFRLA
jgi:hypothetical protein